MHPSAFEAFCEYHQSGMYHVALKILHDRQDAEDAVQSAFTKICSTYRKLGFPSEREERIYALRAVQCTSIDLLRQKRPVVQLDDNVAMPETNCDPTYETVEAREMICAADAAIRVMSQKAQAVFKYRSMGLGDAEIAQSLGMTINDVRVTAHRTKHKLRTLLREEAARGGSGRSDLCNSGR